MVPYDAKTGRRFRYPTVGTPDTIGTPQDIDLAAFFLEQFELFRRFWLILLVLVADKHAGHGELLVGVWDSIAQRFAPAPDKNGQIFLQVCPRQISKISSELAFFLQRFIISHINFNL